MEEVAWGYGGVARGDAARTEGTRALTRGGRATAGAAPAVRHSGCCGRGEEEEEQRRGAAGQRGAEGRARSCGELGTAQQTWWKKRRRQQQPERKS